MKLRDLLAHSLPRVRNKKKKTTPVPDRTAIQFKPNVDSFWLTSSTTESKDASEITEASWHGNALYKGLDSARSVDFDAYTSGIVTSHSAEGFSTQLIALGNHSRMAVSDFNTSSSNLFSHMSSHIPSHMSTHIPSHMSSISNTAAAEPYTSTYCHYHRHEHHYQHYVPGKSMTSWTPPDMQARAMPFQAKRDVHACVMPCQASAKRDIGFFQKSFRSLKKHCGKVRTEMTDNKPMGPDDLSSRCDVCHFPDSPIDRKLTERKPNVKPKRKGVKESFKTQENKEVSNAKGAKCWYSDNEASLTPAHQGRSLFRESSVESCSSQHYSCSREGSAARDFTGFDSASLSGYESDFPKVHRSRSRIKTNPWLPSPQPSGGRRSEHFNLNDVTARTFHRSASFEIQKENSFLSTRSSWTDCNTNKVTPRHRSLTPLDINVTLGMDISKVQARPPKLNDLNVDKSPRPSSIVSPNTEFVMLADNLEQLASNISFEYEDMLDSTLESVSVFLDGGQASIQDLSTDDQMGKSVKKNNVLPSDQCLQSANSPDSGVGGLSSSDAEDVGRSTIGTESRPADIVCVTSSLSNKTWPANDSFLQGMQIDLNVTALNSKDAPLVKKKYPTKFNSSKHIKSDGESSATVSESDVDNSTYSTVEGHKLTLPTLQDRPKCIHSTLMIDERLDIRYPSHHQGADHAMGSTLLKHLSPKVLHGVTTNRYSDPSKVLNRMSTNRHSDPIVGTCLRPSNLNSRHALKINAMETAGHVTGWTVHLPRNISTSECSPTENWQCDVTVSSCSSTEAYEQNTKLKDLIITMKDTRNYSQETLDLKSNSLMESALEHSFDMSDASVQTDFDEDFSRWEVLDFLDNVHEDVIDPVERTRLWLLTGSMQDSADTGYSSLTRETQNVLAGETHELVQQKTERNSWTQLVHRNSPTLLSDVSSDNSFILEIKKYDPGLDGNKKVLQVPNALHTTSKNTCSTRFKALPEETVHQMFSGIELQFQEIFKQIEQHENNCPHKTELKGKPKFSNASDTMDDHESPKLSPARDGQDDHDKSKVITTRDGQDDLDKPKVCTAGDDLERELKSKSLTDAETGENKNHRCFLQSGELGHDDISTLQGMKTFQKTLASKHLPNDEIKETLTEFSVLHRNTLETLRDTTHSDIQTNDQLPAGQSQDKADYLAFLKDVPLRRHQLKRPLYLVPGVGPVDMSNAEQMNMVYERHSSLPGPSLSPTGKHNGKKIKFKKGQGQRSERNRIQSLENAGIAFQTRDLSLSSPHPLGHLDSPHPLGHLDSPHPLGHLVSAHSDTPLGSIHPQIQTEWWV
ncbi:hypothetical protein BgiBS90_022107 [Biomphalaria glabrata]|nr:hypothetical protein BgiBS90_022107 [Biomphalaria glabrata]